MCFCLYHCFTEVALIRVTFRSDGLKSVSSIWYLSTFSLWKHTLASVTLFRFSFYVWLFLLILFAGSSSSTQLVCVGFFGGLLELHFLHSRRRWSHLSHWLEDRLYPVGSYVFVSGFDLTSNFGLVYAVADWISPGTFPKHFQLNTFSVEHLISAQNYLFFLLLNNLSIHPAVQNRQLIDVFDSSQFLVF